MATWQELGITKYQDYFTTPHWLKIKNKLIIHNPHAKCFICSKKDTLLPHHISYANLGKERLFGWVLPFVWGDLVVLCFDCHTKVHFWKLIIPRTFKTPLNKASLVRRMFYLKVIFLTQHKRFGEAAVYFLAWICT